MQAGWTEHQHKKGTVIRLPRQGWTELHFEYSAMVVLRERTHPARRTAPGINAAHEDDG